MTVLGVSIRRHFYCSQRMEDRHCIFSFYELVKIEHNNERIDWGILKKKGEYFLTINKEWENCSVSYKGLFLEDM